MQNEQLISDAERGPTTTTYEKELEILCKYLKSEQIKIDKVQSFVNSYNGILDVISHKHREKNIVQIACSNFAKNIAKEENLRVLHTLISSSNLFYSNKADSSKEAIHYAAISCEEKILQTILEAIKKNEGNVSKINATTADGETALVLILKKRANKSIQCVKVLLNAGVDVDVSDNDNSTAILLALKKLDNYKENNDTTNIIEIIDLLINKACDLDSHKINSMTARDYIEKYKQIHFKEIMLPPLQTPNENTCQYLFGLLKEGRENDFLNHPLLKENINVHNNTITLLQLACARGYKRCVDELLNLKADANVKTEKNGYPLEIAGRQGHVHIFNAVLTQSNFNTLSLASSVLLEITKNLYLGQDFQINHEECLTLLLKHKPRNLDVNYKDQDGTTSLHCSTKMRKLTASLELLKAGALLSERNNDGEMPIQDIDVGTLENYFDYCIHYKQQRIYNNFWLTDEEKKGQKLIEINYTTLLPKEHNSFISHMDVIAEISKKSELISILKHPYVSSFLYLKWHRIRWFHYANILLYAIFCFLLYIYIFFIYLNGNEDSIFLSLFLGFITVILVGREMIQFTSRPKFYRRDFENWMELTLFTVSFIIICRYPPEMSWRKSLASFAIILSAFELVLSLGQVPTFSVYVKMLRQVSCNFLKFILWQVVLLFGFALSFYILFSDAVGTVNFNNITQELNNTNEPKIPNNNEELDMFQNFSLSIVKTMVMLTGEFDASSIKFQLYPLTSILIFLAFVFMISMVVFNLLNGLAVSDIQEIKEHAEIVANMSRLNYILMLESLFEKFFKNEQLKKTPIIKFFYDYFFELIHSNSKFIKKGVALINEKGVFLKQDTNNQENRNQENRNQENSNQENDTVHRQDLDERETDNQDNSDTDEYITKMIFKIWKKVLEVRLDTVTLKKIRHLLGVVKIEKKFSSEQKIIKKQKYLEDMFKELMKEQKNDMQRMEERMFAAVREEVSKIRRLNT